MERHVFSLLIATVLAAPMACAAEPAPRLELPVLLPETEARRYLEADPAFQQAGQAFRAEDNAARQLGASPYEWNATYTRQRRDYGTGPDSQEWNLGLERTWRLPGKARADAAAAGAGQAAASAQWRLARRAAAEGLLNRWLDWRSAQAALALLTEQREAVRENAEAVAKRVASGDASALEQRQADAELADVARLFSEAETTEVAAWAVLSARYAPAAAEAAGPGLPDPVPVPYDAAWWQARLLAGSDALVLARAELDRAQAEAERARAERIPDPTIGIFTGREAFGEEKLVGISISMPLPGERRSLERERQAAIAAAARDSLRLIERETEAQARAAYTTASGYYQRWKLAASAAASLRDNARLIEKAYRLGEQDWQAVLLTRRQALASAEAEMRARVEALRAYYRLLLDAKLLWSDWLVPEGPLAD